MTSVVELCEALTSAEDDCARAKVIAEASERLEDRYPHLPELAMQGHPCETELRLQKEIERVRLQIKQIRGEIRPAEGRLQRVGASAMRSRRLGEHADLRTPPRRAGY
jgi:hypothetical protein